MKIWMLGVLAQLAQTAAGTESEAPIGKWVFVGTLVLLLLWLICMPRQLIGHSDRQPQWWRNVRVWAVVICIIQIWVYWQFA